MKMGQYDVVFFCQRKNAVSVVANIIQPNIMVTAYNSDVCGQRIIGCCNVADMTADLLYTHKLTPSRLPVDTEEVYLTLYSMSIADARETEKAMIRPGSSVALARFSRMMNSFMTKPVCSPQVAAYQVAL